jgi:hypothetical protein
MLAHVRSRRSRHKQPAATNMDMPEDITGVAMTLKFDERK